MSYGRRHCSYPLWTDDPAADWDSYCEWLEDDQDEEYRLEVQYADDTENEYI